MVEKDNRVGHTEREKSDKCRKKAKEKMNPKTADYLESLEKRIKILEDLLL